MTLFDEIKARCPPQVLSGRDPQAIADAVSVGRVIVGCVARGDFAIWAATTGMRSKIEDTALNTQSPLRDTALACQDLLLGVADGIDFAKPANIGMLAAWVKYGGLTQANADGLLAIATTPNPITEFNVRCTLWAADGAWLGG